MFVEKISTAEDHPDLIAFINNVDEAETAFASPRRINALAIRTSFDRSVLVKRCGAQHWDGRAAAAGEIAVRSVIGAKHVGVAVEDADALDLVLLDEIGDFAPLRRVNAPVILRLRVADQVGSAWWPQASDRRIGMMNEPELIRGDRIIIRARLTEPRDGTHPENHGIKVARLEQLLFEPGLLPGAQHGLLFVVRLVRRAALRTQVGEDEPHAAHRECLVDRHVSPAGAQRIVWHVFLVGQPCRFPRRGGAAAVVAGEVMIVPNVNEGNVAIKFGLCRRSQDAVVGLTEPRAVVGRDVQVMKVPIVKKEQRVVSQDGGKHRIA